MCFKIDEQAVRPTDTRVWKRLGIETLFKARRRAVVNLISPMKSHFPLGRGWRLRVARELGSDEMGLTYTDIGIRRAVRSGLYVYAREAPGALLLMCASDEVLVECQVDPADWLFSEFEGNARTYRRIKPMKIVAVGCYVSQYACRKLKIRKALWVGTPRRPR